MTKPASADEFPQQYPDATSASFTPDSTVLPITELPGFVDEERFDSGYTSMPAERFSDPTSPHPTTESVPFASFPEPVSNVVQLPIPQSPQPAPAVEPVASTPAPSGEASTNKPPVAEDVPLPPTPDWVSHLSLDADSHLDFILKGMDELFHNGDHEGMRDSIVNELRYFLRDNKLTKDDFAQLLASKGWTSTADYALLDSVPDRRFKLPRWRKAQPSEEAPVTSSDADILPTEVDPDSGKITSQLDRWKVMNKAQRAHLAHRLGLDKTIRIGNLEVKSGRLVGGILGAIAVGATVMGVMAMIRQGDTSALEASSGGTGGGLDPTQSQSGGAPATAPTTEAVPTTTPDTSSSPLPETTTPEVSDTTTAPPTDSSAPAPEVSDVPDTPPVDQDTNPANQVTVETGDTVYDLGSERGLTDTQIANGIEDGSIKAYDAQGNEVNVHEIQPGYTVDFNVDTAGTTSAPVPTDVPAPSTEVQPEIPAGSEPIHLEQDGTLSESVQDWLEQHGRTDDVDDATQAIMNYNQSLGIDLDMDTAHNLHSTNIDGQAVATLNGQPIQMPPEAMFDQLMFALENES